MREHLSFDRIGVMPSRAYYIPFDINDRIKTRYGIIDRTQSSRFISLDGIWGVKQLLSKDEFYIDADITASVPVPFSLQMLGFGDMQYINSRYPFPAVFPDMPNDIPAWHYRRYFDIEKRDGEKYYINFEGVDSAFYLYINNTLIGYSQISHATSEFDITDYLLNGKNRIDVLVLKWCISSYLECQDKWRLSGIFRSVYILKRPREHISDYFIKTTLTQNDGTLIFKNESKCDVEIALGNKRTVAHPGGTAKILVKNVKRWSAQDPYLYTLRLFANGEVIIEKVGFREIKIDGCVFKINGEAVKLLGVNRHEFSPKSGATVSLYDTYRDLKIIKSLSMNAVRTSHYPNMPEFYQLCDAMGIYVMDEADVETHGASLFSGSHSQKDWQDFAENMLIEKGIYDRQVALVQRDKNRPSVIIWSLGNESSFGRAFIRGAKYIRKRDDSRPVHYEGLQNADKRYYYTPLVDMCSMMYPSVAEIRQKVLNNPKETRPFVLCEYTHAMGNSCGDVGEYVDLIRENEQIMGGFVWEFKDHGIKTKKGYLYGGDFGETAHDSNFCIDGLLAPDCKLKSSAYEVRAAYSGKQTESIKHFVLPKQRVTDEGIEVFVDEKNGSIISVKRCGEELLKSPVRFNLMRYTDNERLITPLHINKYLLPHALPYVKHILKQENFYSIKGCIAAPTQSPIIDFTLEYRWQNNVLDISVEYEISERIENLPRVGLEFEIDKSFEKFGYIGFGPYESYVDKHRASSFGYYESSASQNYDKSYIRPQESGSHLGTKYLRVDGLFELYADAPYSFSLNPYSTEQLVNTRHAFEIKRKDTNTVCIDLYQRGIGSRSCGPVLDKKYEIPRHGKNKFRFVF